nr:hypothetical protein [Lachnospiraceae bacterium]
MTEGIIAFVIWILVSLVFVGIGIYDLQAKEVAGFWSNGKKPIVKDENLKAYNRSVGILWIGFAVFFMLLGLPLLAGDNSPLVVITLLGSLAEIVILMAVYVLVIEKKYCEK